MSLDTQEKQAEAMFACLQDAVLEGLPYAMPSPSPESRMGSRLKRENASARSMTRRARARASADHGLSASKSASRSRRHVCLHMHLSVCRLAPGSSASVPYSPSQHALTFSSRSASLSCRSIISRRSSALS